MIVFSTIRCMFLDSNSLLVVLLSLIMFGLYFFKMNKSSRERDRLLSLLPSITKNLWGTLKVSWTISRFVPKDIIPYFESLFKIHGSIFHGKIANRNYVFLNDPDDIKVLLSNTQHITKGPEYKMLEPWLNTGLLTSTDQKWQSRRKMLTNTFHFKILDTYIPALNKHSRRLVKNFIQASENGNSIEDLDSFVTLCALDIIFETIMGVKLRSQEGKSIEYVNAIKIVSNILMKRFMTFWYWNDWIFRMSIIGRQFYKSISLLHNFTENVIKERREILKITGYKEIRENRKKRVYSFLDLLIEVSNKNPDVMTDLDIREEVDTFLFEGHDTSSIALTMAFIHLGLNRNVQDTARKELYKIFGDNDRDATMEDLKEMLYLERVIKETLRLYPSVPGTGRKLKEPLYLEKYTIPVDTIIGISFFMLHRDEKTFPNPEKFDPDRFLHEQCIGRHPYAYLPFSAGPRNCIGQKFAMYQMKIVLSTILRFANIESKGTENDISVSAQLVLRADHLPCIRITPLHKNMLYT